MSEAFKRYMVFAFSDYDNGHPFDGVEDFEQLEDATARYHEHDKNQKENAMIFDRVDGVILRAFSDGAEL